MNHINRIIKEEINNFIKRNAILSEITIKDKYNKESSLGKTKLDYNTYAAICQLDPTYNRETDKVGKYTNWLLAKVKTQQDMENIRVPLEWYADGVKRGILQRSGISPDINAYRSVDDLINAVNSIMKSEDSEATVSNSEFTKRQELEGQFKVVAKNQMFELIEPRTWQAERWFGRKTAWCTVANEDYFNRYGGNKGELLILYPLNQKLMDKRIQITRDLRNIGDVTDEMYINLKEIILTLSELNREVAQSMCDCFEQCGFDCERDYILTVIEHYESGNFLDDNGCVIKGLEKYIINVTIPNGVTSIGESAFCNCFNLTSITIPNGVTSIGTEAFYYCSSLTSVTIPNSVTSIGGWAFQGCSSLTSITIPNSVTSIGGGAFCDCSRLTSATIPNSVTSIDASAFENCTSLTSITIPNSITSIGESAFWRCSSLASITIPNSVTSIGNWAFCGCSSLASITIPNSVTSIGESAFRNCTSLTSVFYNGFEFTNASKLEAALKYNYVNIGMHCFDSTKLK